MSGTLVALALASATFVGLHFLLSHRPVRARLVAHMGERGFTIAYSALALLSLLWMILAYRTAPHVALWATPAWLGPVSLVVMLPVTVLLVVGLLTPSPTAVQSTARLTPGAGRGILAITRHPFLWAAAGWAVVHLAANGDAASLILFGSLLVLAVGGTFHIDRRRRAALGAPWMAYAARTSNIPFIALVEGRATGPRVAEIGAWRLALALAIYAGALAAHGVLGPDPLAGLAAVP